MTAAENAQWRLFVALPIDSDARQAIEAVLARCGGAPGRAAPSENWHFTLRFFGYTNEAQRTQIATALQAAQLGAAFDYRLSELGGFPRVSRARVVWVGVDRGAQPMRALAEAVERIAVGCGFAPEVRAFRPHLTVARADPPTDASALTTCAGRLDIDQRARECVLYRSHLSRSGPRYESIARYPLGAG